MLKKKSQDKILDILFAEGAIEESEIAKINDEIKDNKETASEILFKKGKVSEQILAASISKSSGIPLIDLAKEKISREALDIISADEAKKNLIVPFYLDDKVLKIAVADPEIVKKNDARLWQRVRRKSGRKIDLYIACFSDIKFGLKHFGAKENSKMIKAFEEKKINSNPSKKEEGILEVLVTQDLIQPEEVKKLKAEAEKKKMRIDDLLLEEKKVSPDELAKAYSSLYQYPFIRLRNKDILYEVITKFPEEISRKYHLIAFEMIGLRVVKVALSRPFDPQINELLKFVSEKNELEVDRYITTDDEIEEALKVYQQPANSYQQSAGSWQP